MVPTAIKQYVFPQIGDYMNLVITQGNIPDLRANDVLLKVHAVSLNFRDLVVASGVYGNWSKLIKENLVTLSDMAGEIVALGEEVKNWKVGDRVIPNFATDFVYGAPTSETFDSAMGAPIQGVLAEYKVVPAQRLSLQSLVTIPDHLSYEEASTLPCAAVTAYNALYGPVPVKAGHVVLIQGTGGVSIFALQIAVAAGATVIATSSSDEKLKIASKLGAKYLINYNKTPQWDQEVMKLTNGAGVDHVVEVGGEGTLSKSINCARIGSAHVHIIGFVSSDKSDSQGLTFPIMRRGASLRGIQVGSVSQFVDLIRLMIANPEVTRPVVDQVFPFEEAVSAYAYLESRKHVGKVVIKVSAN